MRLRTRTAPCREPLGSPRSGTAARAASTLFAALGLGLAAPALLAQPPGSQAPPPRPSPSEGQVVEAYISEDALQVLYGRRMDVGEFGRNDVRVGVFLNEERDLIGIADMLIDIGQPGRRPHWALQAGPRAYAALMSIESQDVFAIGLGGRLSYFLGGDRRTSVSIAAYYAPDIVTFGNADNVKDVSLRIETPLNDDTYLFIGYRMFEFDLEVDRKVDDNLHIGIRHRF
jgi:hypothetical protein